MMHLGVRNTKDVLSSTPNYSNNIPVFPSQPTHFSKESPNKMLMSCVATQANDF